MVFFSCNSCGTSLKKNQVEKHSFSCKSTTFSCIDCSKDFHGNDYKKHNQCVSEDQKYGGLNYQPKAGANKGQAKQEKWIECVKAAISAANASKDIARHLDKLVEYENIPRKKPKFENFVKNSLHIYSSVTIDSIWQIFDAAIKMEKALKETEKKDVAVAEKPDQLKRKEVEEEEVTEEAVDAEERPKKKNKQKKAEGREESALSESNALNRSDDQKELEEDVDAEAEPVKKGKKEKEPKFKWMKAVKAILLQQEGDHELPVKKLRKMVMAVYNEAGGKKKATVEEITQKLDKFITGDSKQFKVTGKVIKYVGKQ